MENSRFSIQDLPQLPENRDKHRGSVPAGLLRVNDSPLGYFTVSGKEKLVEINEKLVTILGLNKELSLPQTEGEFWEMVANTAVDPGSARVRIDGARDRLEEHPVLTIEVRNSGWMISIFLFPIMEPEEGISTYAGVVVDTSSLQQALHARSVMMGDLALQARKSSASILGKLEALEGNLMVWSKEVQADILQEILDQQKLLNNVLDLSLNLTQALGKQEVYYERIDLEALMEQIIAEEHELDIHLVPQSGEDGPLPLVQLDPALMRVAIINLLQGIQQQTLPGKIEISLSSAGGQVFLRFGSPRTMSLPGMMAGEMDSRADFPNVRLFLADRMITAQGGSLQLERTNQEGGIISTAEISFAVDKPAERTTAKRLPGDDPYQDVGRVLLALAQPDQQIRLRDALQESGYRVDIAIDGSMALDLAQRNNPELIILSRSLPGLDGLLVTQGIRRWSAIPILMISERSNPDDLVYAYQLGVDDYLRIPIIREELLAKVRVHIRRSAAAKNPISPEVYQTNLLKIDYSTRQVWIRGRVIDLTPIEYNLLVYLSRHANQIVPYDQLLESVWEGPEKGTRQGLFVHIKRIREKIESDPKHPQIITNKWGVGYVFNP